MLHFTSKLELRPLNNIFYEFKFFCILLYSDNFRVVNYNLLVFISIICWDIAFFVKPTKINLIITNDGKLSTFRYSSDEIHFNLMAIVSDKKANYEKKMKDLVAQTEVSRKIVTL